MSQGNSGSILGRSLATSAVVSAESLANPGTFRLRCKQGSSSSSPCPSLSCSPASSSLTKFIRSSNSPFIYVLVPGFRFDCVTHCLSNAWRADHKRKNRGCTLHFVQCSEEHDPIDASTPTIGF